MPISTLNIPAVIGHRGLAARAPENTIKAIEMAHECGITFVEFDVQLSKCETPLLMHDLTLNRTTNGNGYVANYDIRALKALDAGTFKDSKFSDCTIPTLEEVIVLLNKLQMNANIELKSRKGMEEATTQRVLEVVHNTWKDSTKTPILSSFSNKIMQFLRAFDKDIPLATLTHFYDKKLIQLAIDTNSTAVHVNYKRLSEKRAQHIKEHGFLLGAYTVNDALIAQKLYDWGVDYVFSDRADSLIAP